MKKNIVGILVVLGFATQVFAHQLWLEREGNVLKEFFGHFPHFKEKDSGKRLKAIKGINLTPKEAYVATKRSVDHLDVTIKSKGDIGITEVMSPRKGKFVDFIVRTIFLAREGRSETKDLLALDLVPKNPESNTFIIKINKESLPKSRIKVIAPNGWSKSYMSNISGEVTIQTPWKGDYVVQSNYTDKTKGKADGKAYEQTNYVMTIHFVVK
jgi:hypothetical protein